MAKRATDRIKLQGVTISYPKIFEPEENMSGKVQYSAQFVIPKNHPQLKELQEKVLKVAKEAFPKLPLKNLKIGLKNNDTETKSDGTVKSEADPRLKGTFYFNANADVKRQPQVVDRRLRVVTDDSGLYAGCKVNASISIFSYEVRNEKGGVISQGVGFGLGNIQVVETGERWDGRRNANEEFEVLDEDEVETGATADAVATEEATSGEGDDLPWN